MLDRIAGRVTDRPRHTRKQVEQVIRKLEGVGWTIIYPSGHWGRAKCGDGCLIVIPGTPKNSDNAAKQVLRKAQKCPHGHRPS